VVENNACPNLFIRELCVTLHRKKTAHPCLKMFVVVVVVVVVVNSSKVVIVMYAPVRWTRATFYAGPQALQTTQIP